MANHTVFLTSNAILALMTKLEKMYAGSDNNFLVFSVPAMPLTPHNFNFLENNSGLTPQEKLQAQSEFARITNLIPAYKTLWFQDGRMLWDEYETILSNALVASKYLSAAEKVELQAANEVLYEKQTDQNSHKLLQYYKFQELYLEAYKSYNDQKLKADNSTDLEVKQNWQSIEPQYKAAVDKALHEWQSFGHKSEVEEAFADRDRITDSNYHTTWNKWHQIYREFRATDLANIDFWPTFFYPSNFFRTDSITDWAPLKLDSDEIEALCKQASEASRVIMGASHSEANDGKALNIDISQILVELMRVDIIRPWFKPSIFKSRFWKWPDDREPLSDGQDPPCGGLPGYITSIILARNLVMKPKPSSISNERIINNLQENQQINISPLHLERISEIVGLTTDAIKQTIAFDTFPDGIPIASDLSLNGNEFFSKGILLSGSPEDEIFPEATSTAIRYVACNVPIKFPILTSAVPGKPSRYNVVPIKITFTRTVNLVALKFLGNNATYTLEAFDKDEKLIGTSQKSARFDDRTAQFKVNEIIFESPKCDIKSIRFGNSGNMTMVKEIHYEFSENIDVEGNEQPEKKGFQLIAFVCQKLPKSPNPDPALTYS
ncbi:hypothetical protein IQ254_29235 [Nodosilinea sp. LEGE 07088]|uniref:hypothetical protein n=1 Tax=Nodosilinea sp. LEGE 07088 TaxID=2777968 RepID=UPI0018804D85|nr:hypothetical protein [Nodosilinea sp. LEGE 07088]MBE9141237.1 hypothetical protein [Nodosilinea sp. LEGE 07088]